MTETNQNHLIEKLTDALTAIGLDIREIKTTLLHFGEKFDRVHQDVHEIKSNAKENEHEIETLMLKNNILENEIQDMKKDVQILFGEFKERDSKSVADRKWLIGTVISVVLLGIAVINQFI
ncbi:MAG: hypothetical protein IMZ40_01905 [Bacilli bacterium]|nr:hypothetical protein [Bacilli bacterium]